MAWAVSSDALIGRRQGHMVWFPEETLVQAPVPPREAQAPGRRGCDDASRQAPLPVVHSLGACLPPRCRVHVPSPAPCADGPSPCGA